MKMKKQMKTKLYFLLLLFSPFLLNGCFEIDEEFEKIRDEVIKSFGDDYKSEYLFSVGSFGITISSWFVDIAAEDNLPSDILDDINSVQVGVYKKLAGTDQPGLDKLRGIENKMIESGWRSIIKSSKDGELSAVYVRTDPNQILNRIFVISIDGSELALIEIEGNLKEAISTVIREKGLKADI